MTPCAACDTAVDPLRSRFVGVRDGKVVAYCSAECAAGGPRARAGQAMSPATGVPVRIATPPAGVPVPPGPPDGLAGPVDSGPVIEILHEPASGVVTSAPDRRIEPRARHPDEISIAAFWAADKAARQGIAGSKADVPRGAGEADPSAAAAERDAAGARTRGALAAEAPRSVERERTGAREPREAARTGRDAAESSPGQRVAAEAGTARGARAEGTRRDSAESSQGQGAAADAAGAARDARPEGTERDSAESSGGPRAADAAGVVRGALAGVARDSAESSQGQRAAVEAGTARGARAEWTGRDSAESSGAQRAAADTAGAARDARAERTERDSAESSGGQRAAADAAGTVRRDQADIGRDSPESPGTARGARAERAGRAAAESSEGQPDARGAPRRTARWPVVVLILVLLGAGAGLLYYFFGGLSGHAAGHATGAVRGALPAIAAMPAARAELSRPVRPSQAAAAAAPVVDLTAAIELARSALRRDLAATSPRVQRLAAVALARTQDPQACELLAAQIGLGSGGMPVRVGAGADELAGNDIARLGLAYALARGGDRRGTELLARALGAPRGEARDEAAGLLARLGDRRSVPHLLDLLAVEQRRLAAAEHLARLAEPRALQVLDRVRGDPRASADDKARATVALGAAGRDAVAGALRDMLGDPHFNAFAAAALAAQGDRAARPVLERQLASPPLRVQAARALRRLDPAIDPRPLLPPLLDVVRAGRDIDRIPAAEAILLLAGPAGWSAFD